MMDNLPLNGDIKREEDFPKCKAKEIIKGELVECLESRPLCQHYLYFGNSIYCTQPLKLEIAKRTREENETRK